MPSSCQELAYSAGPFSSAALVRVPGEGAKLVWLL
jgi:hypothetical protein